MHAFASHLLSATTTEAVWVDTTGAFAGGRLKDVIISRLQPLLPQEVKGEDGEEGEEGEEGEGVLARAKITRAFDLVGLAETLHEIRTDHERRRDDRGGHSHGDQGPEQCTDSADGVGLVVVDDISLPYASMVNRSFIQGAHPPRRTRDGINEDRPGNDGRCSAGSGGTVEGVQRCRVAPQQHPPASSTAAAESQVSPLRTALHLPEQVRSRLVETCPRAHLCLRG